MTKLKPNVIHVCSDTNVAGAGKCLITFLKAYDRERLNVSVALHNTSQLIEAVQDLAQVHKMQHGADKSIDFLAIGEFYKLFRATRPLIVHTHGSLSARIGARLAGVKHIFCTRHSYFPQPKWKTQFPAKQITGFINCMLADRFIAVADVCRENLVGVPDCKVKVILNGIFPLQPMDKGRQEQVRSRLGIGQGVRIVSITARLTQVKGHSVLLHAAANILQRREDVCFVIAGTGEELESLTEQAQQLGLSRERVVFTGFIEDVAPLINITDILVNASYGTEATSISLLEGMSLGKPIVATDFGGNPAVVVNGKNGILVPIKDSAAMADAIVTLLEDESLYAKMSKEAKEMFNQSFTAAAAAKQTVDYYLELLN